VIGNAVHVIPLRRDMTDVVKLIDAREAAPKKRGPYRKRENSN